MAKDELNSGLLGNEVIAVEMGASITNLTDSISIKYHKIKQKGIPSCCSWNGEGHLPVWTNSGCETITDGDNITCNCSHLTFFAVLMAPLNITMSTSDLTTLTTITQIGCGLSMFFLSVVLFMHFLIRRAKATAATHFLIHLISAMFLLNLTFLTNHWVAKIGNSAVCKMMAAVMHYFMLVTFTWFAMQAFHFVLHVPRRINTRHYVVKVALISWLLPSVIVIVLLITAKYGKQVINTDEANVNMCWIADSNVHNIVNIGYYAVVFLFTFTAFIVIFTWLICLRTKAGTTELSGVGKRVVTIMGLFCILGISWGFAFFAYGAFQKPAYYIFTILNSFQGFFLFIYYYKTRNTSKTEGGLSVFNLSSTKNTVNTAVEDYQNPYEDMSTKPKNL
ncbi:adhesion G-protein coupled receptor G2-like [Thalassophryne amazonica]|uniref:adhesion G-protein coupled receptor G2-like n=1 Tax=Thalassophryne amazonica TaxID=390379 RepID=UPI001471C857|nr:adhesion G-protein coupled receptor G2-like [Thalassophryne amazonica]